MGLAERRNSLQSSEIGEYYTTDDFNVDFDNRIDASALPNPIINANWILKNHDGVSNYNPPSITGNNLIVAKGTIAKVTSSFIYYLDLNELAPEIVSGDFGTADPGEGVTSEEFSYNGNEIINDKSFSVTFAKENSGLLVDNNQVINAQGNSYTTASLRIFFRDNYYFGVVNNQLPSVLELENLMWPSLIYNKNISKSAVSSQIGEYIAIAYPSSFGILNNVILDGSSPILGAFTRLPNISLKNKSGLLVDCIVYISNADNAFNNNNLTFN